MNASDLAPWRYPVIAQLLHQENGASLRDLAQTVAQDVLRGMNGDPVPEFQPTTRKSVAHVAVELLDQSQMICR